MEPNDKTAPADHLTDDALFALAVPTAGVPEALPPHLMECLACSRALTEWKSAVRDLGDRDDETLAARSAEDWGAAEDATLAAVRRAGAPGRGRPPMIRWALPMAASLFLVLLLVPGRDVPSPTTAPIDETAGLSAQDRADDALLRDVDRLAMGEESATDWDELAPDPSEEPS
ncbi:MAG: hypothetical protein M3542_11550 [Acidobacteriota bacterium]|nr:hypothetical protein [Acidobacteriota bacterium]MDQ5871149.1 hypothetical protein [Acidobacteriota bacterium]